VTLDARAPDLSVILPAFNAGSFIRSTVGELLAYLDAKQLDAEIVVADDGSTDGTSDLLPPDPRVRVVQLPRNRGKGAALRAGMLEARGKVRIFTDADLPYGTAPIAYAYGYISKRRFHAVIGDRTLPGSRYAHTGLLRSGISAIASFTFRTLVTGGVYDTQCGLKGFRGDVADELFRLAAVNGFAIDVELIYLLLKYRLDVKRIPVRLQQNAPSSVRVLRDSLRASVDILRMRARWARGRYASQALVQIGIKDLSAEGADLDPAAPDQG
jgi:dolichyl-phosphate beta-glucosyltransferase